MNLRCGVLLAALASVPAAGEERRVTVLLDAGLSLQEHSFESARTFREFAEDGTLRTRSAAGRGTSLGGAVQLRFGRFGVLLGGSASPREVSGSYEARLPHPLYLDRHRAAGGTVSGSYRETEVYAALAWLGRTGRLDLRLFAGPSYFASVSAETPSEVRYAHAFPFDEVNVQGVSTSRQEGAGVGFTAGLGADWRLGQRLGVGVQGRYGGATVSLTGGDPATTLDVDAGGLTATLGLRVRF